MMNIVRFMSWCQLVVGVVLAGIFLVYFPLQAAGQLAREYAGTPGLVVAAVVSAAVIGFAAMSLTGRLPKLTRLPAVALFAVWWIVTQVWQMHRFDSEPMLHMIGYLVIALVFAALGVGLVVLSQRGPRCCG